eukprot:GCRY01002042.1.p1 GENE.GCRY01002042.1~~GCRY01002042.1.p1  ORF type:complete len:318 (+),score=60.15 GCRY01002042.1:117-1070(+)
MVLNALENIVTRDEGERGISPLLQRGFLQQAAEVLLKSHRVAILTGYPCLLDHSPPTETDGPLGAFAVQRALHICNIPADILTDDINADSIATAYAIAQQQQGEIGNQPRGRVLSFPPGPLSPEKKEELMRHYDCFLAIERSGASSDGQYYTMGGKNMTPIMASLDDLIPVAKKLSIPTIAVGDGGNEVGMGRVFSLVQKHIKNGTKIAAVVEADVLGVVSVSNWGGYALAAALGLCASVMTTPMRLLCVPSREEEQAVMAACVSSGMRDGITGRCESSVDGMPFEKSLAVLEELRRVVITALSVRSATEIALLPSR